MCVCVCVCVCVRVRVRDQDILYDQDTRFRPNFTTGNQESPGPKPHLVVPL